MKNRFKIIETVIENNSDVVTEEDFYDNMSIAYTNYNQAKNSFISNIMHRMSYSENENVQYTIELIDHKAGLVIENFSFKFKNFNLSKNEKLQ